MFSYHPPEVVTLSRSATGVHTPETESPLSSAPNSPRSSHGMFESSANLLQELLLQEKQAQQQAEQNQLQQKQQILRPEAPFDEAVDVDEKKFDGDELMGQQSPQTQQHHVDILNNDFDHNDDDDESEPPSLAVHRTPKRLDVPFEDPQLIVMMMTTPLQPLPSPPPLIKQTMPWEAAMGSPESAPIREEEATLIDDSQGKFSRVDSNNSNKENPTVQLKQDCQESQNLQEEIDDFDVIAESIPLYERRQFIPAEQDMQEVVPTPQYKERPTLKGHRSISEPVLNDWNKYLKNYRQMTPKRDLSMSEKSAAWLQEEFKRRSTMKQEINNAILGRNNQEISEEVTVKEMIDSLQESLVFVPEDKDDIPAHELQGDFAAALSKALEALPPSSSPDSKVDCSQHSEDDEIVALTTATVVAGDEDGPAPRRLDYEYQQHMQRFVNDTRVALRESETGFRSLATESPPPTEARSPAMSRSSNVTEDSDIDISITPILVHSMDSYLGIAKGDITLSLLNENTYTPQKATWATRVQAAIWRCRGMRRNMGGIPVLSQSPTRSSLPVDMDNARVTGGIRNVQTTQEAALRHLQQDEVEEAMELFEDIIFAYYAYFERTLRAREANLGVQADGITDFRPYIGVALHNLGILNLLKGQYREALSYFGRALDHRKASLGEGHPDHVVRMPLSRLLHAFLVPLSRSLSTFYPGFIGQICHLHVCSK